MNNDFPAGNYMFKVNNRNIRKRCEICSKLTIKTPEQCYWRRAVTNLIKFDCQLLNLIKWKLSRQHY